MILVVTESADDVTLAPAALRRIPLPEQIKDLLLGRIVDGCYRPGLRLVETRIARELGVSQGPVREALRELAGMGLVGFEANRGCRVRAVDQHEIDEVSLVRAALEETAARLAAARQADVALLAAHVDGMAAAAAQGDPRRWIGHAVRFHRGIVVAAANRVLLATWESLAIEARTAQLVLTAGFDLAAGADEHRRILDALAAGDARLAAQLSRDHEESFVAVDPSA
jgi:DNA-binding GntR family transcriptional regulator